MELFGEDIAAEGKKHQRKLWPDSSYLTRDFYIVTADGDGEEEGEAQGLSFCP